MPYSTAVVVIVPGGGTITFEAKLWEAWADQQVPQETVPVAGGQIAFMGGPDFLANGHSVGVTVGVQGGSGPVFRSGLHQTLPAGDPDGLIEVFVADNPAIVNAGDITASLPSLPLTVTGTYSHAVGSITVTLTLSGVTVTLVPGSMTLVLTGTAGMTNVPSVGFTYTIVLNLVPSWSLAQPATVLEVQLVGSPTLSFVSTGPVVSTIEAAVLNLAAGLIEKDLTPPVLARIEAEMNRSAITQAETALARSGGPSTLPAGVILSARQAAVRQGDVAVWPALGAYGGLWNRLFPSGTTNGPCAVTVLAALSDGRLDLDVFRALRDSLLESGPAGREFVSGYHSCSGDLVRVLAADRRLIREAIDILAEVQRRLIEQRPIDDLLPRAQQVGATVAARSSDVREVLAALMDTGVEAAVAGG